MVECGIFDDRRVAIGKLVSALLILGICGQATISSGQLIVAHRGASHDAPENTMAAFRLAWERGADGIEGDFYLSSDSRVVCIHDKDTERVAGVKLVVAETSFDELRKLDVGAWKDEKWRGERMPTLQEVLATVPPKKKIFIELKVGPEIADPVANILVDSSLKPEQIVFISFNEKTIAAIEERLPHYRSHWLTGYKQDEQGTWKPSAQKVSATVHRIGADGLGSNANLDFVNQAFIGQYRKTDEREFHVWTVDKLEVARKYQKLGAWGITTNRPGWLRKNLQIR